MKNYKVQRTFKNGSTDIDVWSEKRIKEAFNHGNGTINDLIRFVNDNNKNYKLLP